MKVFVALVQAIAILVIVTSTYVVISGSDLRVTADDWYRLGETWSWHTILSDLRAFPGAPRVGMSRLQGAVLLTVMLIPVAALGGYRLRAAIQQRRAKRG